MHRRFVRRALLPVFALSLVPLTAAAASKSSKPAPVSKLVKAVDIPHESFVLPNGLKVITHTDRKAPVVAVSVWYHIGSKHEPKGKTGFAHLFEHLMFNGSENAPGDFFAPLREVGATDFNGTTNFDRTNYFQTVPKGALDLTLFLESDRMGHLLSGVTKEKLDNQRGVVQNEKRQGDNQPYGLTFYEILGTLFPEGHPYHHSPIGSMADLDAASLEDVKQWFRDGYGPNNAVLVLAGDIDAKSARPMVEKWFGDIPRGPDVKHPRPAVPTLAAPVTKTMKDKVATTRLYRLWAIPGLNHADATELEMAAWVLGGLSSSRLDNALVRDEKVAVAVTAAAQVFEDVGVFFVTADVKPGEDAARVGARLDAIIADFVKTGPTADELQRVATSSVSQTIQGIESVGGFTGKAVTLAEGQVYSADSAFYKKELAELSKVKPADVTRAMGAWLTRPVFNLIVEPGERGAYTEAKGSGGAAKAGEFPATFNYVAPGDEAAGFAPLAAVDRSKFPPVADLSGLDFPDIERDRLGNGIEVVFARRAGVPLAQVSVSFDAGYAADPADALGTQSLMLGVMSEGTATRSSKQIAEESERLGTNIAYGATMDRTTIGMTALTPNLGASLDLLADVVRNPAFAPAEVERVRAQQLARIAAELTQPQALAVRVLPVKIYGASHPYGRSPTGTGDPAVVKSLTSDQLRGFHTRWFRPDTARIFVVGDTDMKTVKALLEKSFGTWASNRMARPGKDFSTPIPVPTPKIYLVDRPNSPQSVIVGGQVLSVSGRDDLVTLRAANENLGGNFLSRINMDLRETKGWSYGSRSQIGGVEERTSFSVAAPVQADRTGDSIKALQQQIGDFLSTRGITAEELKQTVNGNVRQLPGQFETSGDVLGGVANIINLGRPDDYYEKIADKYRAMTAADIDATARALIDPKKMVYVVVGDVKKVRAQLDAVGLPVEEVAAPSAK
jgi:predicted Zn-dependent peptidase